jgi:hypothetical protein
MRDKAQSRNLWSNSSSSLSLFTTGVVGSEGRESLELKKVNQMTPSQQRSSGPARGSSDLSSRQSSDAANISTTPSSVMFDG